MFEDDTPPAPPPEHDPLDALDAEAAALDAAATPPDPNALPVASLADKAEALRDALGMARMMVAPAFGWWEHFGDVWSDATLANIANGGAAVMEKHGLTFGDLMADWGPYIALAGATLPPAITTYGAIKHRKKAQP